MPGEPSVPHLPMPGSGAGRTFPASRSPPSNGIVSALAHVCPLGCALALIPLTTAGARFRWKFN